MDKELLKKIATVILEHYEEDDNYFEDGYHRNPSDIFKTPVDLKFDTDIYGVDLDVILKSGEKIKAYWHLDGAGSGNKTLKGSSGTEYDINQVEKWRFSEKRRFSEN